MYVTYFYYLMGGGREGEERGRSKERKMRGVGSNLSVTIVILHLPIATYLC